MTGIRIRTLGALHIERDGEEIRDLPAQPVRCSLLLYLAIERTVTRDELAALFWPESDAERARHALSQTLYELRRTLGDDWVEADAERVRVTATVSVDALDFMTAVEQGRNQDALAAYAGAFLDASHIGTTKSFESWVDRRRAHLGRLYRELCRRVTAARAETGNLAGALAVARRWAEIEPLDDEAQHRLIELLAATGQRSEALRHYDIYEDLIASELDVEPLDETKELVARIREGTVARDKVHSQQGAANESPLVPVLHESSTRSRQRQWVLTAILIAAVAGAIYFARAWQPSDSAQPAVADTAPSIAVLPFVNMSPDPDQEYFSDGITEDLITNLSRIDGLRVISRTSVMRYKTRETQLADIAAQFDVKYILEGSVRRAGNELRITAQLIDAARDVHLWSETYDRELTGIFEIQSEIAAHIADALQQHLSAEHQARIAGGGTGSMAAYDLVLRGMEYLNRAGAGDVRKYPPAMNFFRHALNADAEYARAYIGISRVFRLHVGLPVTVRMDSALYYARKAVSLEPELPDAVAALGFAHLVAGELPGAEEAFGRVLELDPNHAEAMSGMARFFSRSGRFDQAVRWEQRALDVDPSSATRLVHLGDFLFDLGDLDGAQAAYERALDFAPDFPQPAYLLAMIHLIRGDEERAEQRMRALMTAASDHPGSRTSMGRYLAQLGRFSEAEAYLDGSGRVSPYRAYVAKKTGDEQRVTEFLDAAREQLAAWDRAGFPATRMRLYIQALSGDRDGALATLQQNRRTELREITAGPQIGVYWTLADPLLEDLRDDPRFPALLNEMRVSLDSMRALLSQEQRRVR